MVEILLDHCPCEAAAVVANKLVVIALKILVVAGCFCPKQNISVQLNLPQVPSVPSCPGMTQSKDLRIPRHSFLNAPERRCTSASTETLGGTAKHGVSYCFLS